MSKKLKNGARGVSRRSVLKAAGAVAGVTAVTGFPAVWAAEEKVLRYLGTAVNQSEDITKKVKADTGITIENIVATTDSVCSNANPSQVSAFGSMAALRWKLIGVPVSLHISKNSAQKCETLPSAPMKPASGTPVRSGRSGITMPLTPISITRRGPQRRACRCDRPNC